MCFGNLPLNAGFQATPEARWGSLCHKWTLHNPQEVYSINKTKQTVFCLFKHRQVFLEDLEKLEVLRVSSGRTNTLQFLLVLGDSSVV